MKKLTYLALTGIMLLCSVAFAQKKKVNSSPKISGQSNVMSQSMPAGTGVVQTMSAPTTPQKITSVEGVTEYMLGNGMKVLLFPDPSKQTVTVNITYLVGSRHENYGETGMAHLLEHLVFKGTPKHPNIPQELTSHGSLPNGTTWLDRTNYFEIFQANDENLNWALDLESDRMVNSYIAKKDLDSEMSVVRNEFERGENYPSNVLNQRVTSTAFLWHNYGNSTIGARADIENVNIERLQGFYRKYYQPDNAVLLIAGKFDEGKTLELVNKYFGVIPKPTRVIEKTYTVDPTQDGERQVTLRRVGDIQAVCAAYHTPSGFHPDYFALMLATDILGDNPSGRLYKALIDTKKASQVYSYGFQLKEPGIVYFNAELLKTASLDSAKNILLDVVENLAKNPPTVEEVERLKTKDLTQIDLLLNSSDNVGLYMSEYISQGDWRLLFYGRDQLKKITPEDIKRVVEKYFIPSNRTLGLFIPTEKPIRADIPDAPDMVAMLTNFKGGEVKKQGEAFDPSPANIDARTMLGNVSNIKYGLLQKKTRGESINLQLTARFANVEALKGKRVISDFTKDMLNKGTSKHTRQQINDEFDKLKSRVNFYSVPNDITFRFETERKNLPAVMTLVGEIMRDPIFPADELEKLKNEKIAQWEQQKSEPQYQASNTLARYMNPFPKDDPRYTPTAEEEIEEIKKVTVEDVKKFYKDYYGMSNATMSAVGDFDAEELKKQVNMLFGDWKSPIAFTRFPKVYKDIPAINKSMETPDKANSMFMAGIAMPVNDKDPEFAALYLGNEILGGGFLNSRLATRIRQKEGISYGVGSYFYADEMEKKGYMGFYAIYAPENVALLESAFREEIAKVLKDGYTDKEIEEAKKGIIQNGQVMRAQDGQIMDKLSNYQLFGRTFKYDAEFENRINALTNNDILTAMRKYVVPEKISIVKAGDYEGAAKKMAEKNKGKTGAMTGASKKE
jgi:zinc protease